MKKTKNFFESIARHILNDRVLDATHKAQNNKWEIPSVENLDKRVQSGELIYVYNYTRSDGTKVNGYYRRKPYYARKK